MKKRPSHYDKGFLAEREGHAVNVITRAYFVGLYVAIHDSRNGPVPVIQMNVPWNQISQWNKDIRKHRAELTRDGYSVMDYGMGVTPDPDIAKFEQPGQLRAQTNENTLRSGHSVLPTPGTAT